jgi:hypothetical protein
LDEYERGDVGLKCLVEPVLSNLEELWIDACLLNCAKNTRAYALYQRVIGLRPGQICKDEEIKHVLEEEIATSVGLRRVEDVFPVMRSIVVFVSAGTEVILPEALEIRYSREARYKLKDLYPGRRVSIGENLPVLVKEFPKLAGCGYAVCPIPSGNIVKFSVGDYKYDERYLEKFREEKIYAVYGRPGDSDASKPKVLPAVEPSTKTDERAELETAIQAMEAAGLRDITIKRALWAYKQEAPQYFMEQTPRLPRDMLEKYKSALA